MKLRNLMVTALVSVAATGCFLPQAPGSSKVKSTSSIVEGVELHRMNKERFVFVPGVSEPVRKEVPSGRNLIWVATDDEVQPHFQRQLMEAYKSDTPIRLENVTWWMHAGKVQKLYDEVIRVRYDQFSKDNLWLALEQMEAKGKPYDMFLLTHGVPNHIVTSKGFPLISWKHVAELKGKLKHLNLIFNQACFGDTLVPDWHAAGAKTIIHFKEFNRNFFYLGYYLDDYRKEDIDAVRAFDRTNSHIEDSLYDSRIYTRIIETLGMSMDEYLDTAVPPTISVSP